MTLMYKILNDDTASNLRNSLVRRNDDQTNYHLRNVIGSCHATCVNQVLSFQ